MFEPLNARSNEEVRRLLKPLSPDLRARLVGAMQSIESALEPDAGTTSGSRRWLRRSCPQRQNSVLASKLGYAAPPIAARQHVYSSPALAAPRGILPG